MNYATLLITVADLPPQYDETMSAQLQAQAAPPANQESPSDNARHQ